MSLTSDTKNLLNGEKIALIKKGAIVINTAPMELFNLDALEKRLNAKEITFIFDHTDVGDITESNLKRLQQYTNCITYPAIGYISKEARIAKQDIFVDNMKNFLKDKPTNTVT